jgi:hypothetical protein
MDFLERRIVDNLAYIELFSSHLRSCPAFVTKTLAQSPGDDVRDGPASETLIVSDGFQSLTTEFRGWPIHQPGCHFQHTSQLTLRYSRAFCALLNSGLERSVDAHVVGPLCDCRTLVQTMTSLHRPQQPNLRLRVSINCGVAQSLTEWSPDQPNYF